MSLRVSVVKEVDTLHHSGRQEPRPLMSSWHRIIRFHRICAKSEMTLFRGVARPLAPASSLTPRLPSVLLKIVPDRSVRARLNADPGCRFRQMRAFACNGATSRRMPLWPISGSEFPARSSVLSSQVWGSRSAAGVTILAVPLLHLSDGARLSNGSRDDCCEQYRVTGSTERLPRRPRIVRSSQRPDS